MNTRQFPILLLLLSLLSCQPNSKTESVSEVPENQNATPSVFTLAAQEFATKSPKGVLIDVRTPREIEAGKLAGALEIDFYNSNFLDTLNKLSRDKEIYLYCAVGGRSEEAGRQLIQLGFTKVYHLQGGIQAWSQQGLPVE